MTLAIIIVNYRSAALTIDCVQSIADDGWLAGQGKVWVVENASGEREWLELAIARRGWSDWVTVLEAAENRGFSAGNNIALRKLLEAAPGERPDFVLLLNPDTRVRPGGVAALVGFLEGHPAAAIAGSRLENEDGSARVSAFRFPSIWSELESGLRTGLVSRLLKRHAVALPIVDVPGKVDWVCGAAMLVRTSVVERIGLMDEGYFLYFEETDFCMHVRRAGGECWYVPESRVVHLVGRSTGVTGPSAAQRRRPRYWFESRNRYFGRNHGRAYLWAANGVWSAGHLVWTLRRLVLRRPPCDPPGLLWDFLRYWFQGGGAIGEVGHGTH